MITVFDYYLQITCGDFSPLFIVGLILWIGANNEIKRLLGEKHNIYLFDASSKNNDINEKQEEITDISNSDEGQNDNLNDDIIENTDDDSINN